MRLEASASWSHVMHPTILVSIDAHVTKNICRMHVPNEAIQDIGILHDFNERRS